MEEKRYPIIEEEELAGMVCEPMEAAVNSSDRLAGGVMHDDVDNLDWDSYPVFGPKTEEEAVARIDQAWTERNDPDRWIASEQMWKQIYQRHSWLR